MIIAISGKSGCGNTTTSRLLAERLGFRLINYTFRNMAVELGISFEELLERANADPSFDRRLDDTQVEMARREDCVVGSRLAIWLLRDEAFTVYLAASPEVRATRIHGREGGSLEEKTAFTRKRDSEDKRRYRELYGIDMDDYSFVNAVIDVEKPKPEEIVELIIDRMKASGLLAGKAR